MKIGATGELDAAMGRDLRYSVDVRVSPAGPTVDAHQVIWSRLTDDADGINAIVGMGDRLLAFRGTWAGVISMATIADPADAGSWAGLAWATIATRVGGVWQIDADYDGTTLRIAWNESSNIYFMESDDQGATWGSVVTVDGSGGADLNIGFLGIGVTGPATGATVCIGWSGSDNRPRIATAAVGATGSWLVTSHDADYGYAGLLPSDNGTYGQFLISRLSQLSGVMSSWARTLYRSLTSTTSNTEPDKLDWSHGGLMGVGIHTRTVRVVDGVAYVLGVEEGYDSNRYTVVGVAFCGDRESGPVSALDEPALLPLPPGGLVALDMAGHEGDLYVLMTNSGEGTYIARGAAVDVGPASRRCVRYEYSTDLGRAEMVLEAGDAIPAGALLEIRVTAQDVSGRRVTASHWWRVVRCERHVAPGLRIG